MTFFNLKAKAAAPWSARWLFSWIFLSHFPISAFTQDKLPMVPKWTHFEQEFKSSVTYENPLQECALNIEFISPRGETNVVPGFWDGGKTWRVRFRPDQPGRWNFRTLASDHENPGLQNQTGAFLCTVPIDGSRFMQHGPIRPARDGRHFEHQDGTPFFWIADAAWNGARLSEPKDWYRYAQVRAAQKFTAVQWSVAPGKDFQGVAAFEDRTRIIPHPEFFQRLDSKIETLNRAGLLSIVAPLWNPDRQYFDPMPEAQRLLLIRYLAARWSASNVAWLLPSEGATPAEIALWKKIGQDIFAENHSNPVILTLVQRPAFLSEFRDQKWIAGFGFRATDNQAFAKEILNTLNRPLIQITSSEENKKISGLARRITADDTRREIWSNLLNLSSAGTCYSSEAVAAWDSSFNQSLPGDLPLWEKSLFLPGAKQVVTVSDLFSALPFWQLRPAPGTVLSSFKTDRDAAGAAQLQNQALGLFYVAGEHPLELPLTALPRSPELVWLNPRTGEKNPAVAVLGPRSMKFPAPGSGDWVLILKSKDQTLGTASR